MKKAIIVGSEGQDGSYLFEFLQKKKYEVLGLGRNSIRSIQSKGFDTVDITNKQAVENLIKKFQPHEVYYLAAFHQSSQDRSYEDAELFRLSFETNVYPLIHFLEAIKNYSKKTRIFYAASSHIFGQPKEKIQSEETPLNPICVYGITKTAGLQICRFYRTNHSLFASVGILYNHESPRRADKFISKKIINTALDIKEGKKDKLVVGSLTAEIDWGYAPDYVEAMYQILKYSKADEFIVASGKKHSVKDFVQGVFSELGLDWKKYVQEDAKLITKKAKRNLQGNIRKITMKTGWRPRISFKKMIQIMLQEAKKNY